MNTLNKIRNAAFILAIGSLTMTSCDKDDEETPTTPATSNEVTITGIPANADIVNLGTLGPVTATIQGADGLSTLVVTKNGNNFETVDLTGQTTATYEFTYTATEDDEDDNIFFQFTATDVDGDSETVTHVLSVGDAPDAIVTISSNITTNTTWETGKTYILANRVVVTSGNTLTIQPGVIIKGEVGTGANASALMVARGAKIDAQGTETQPIIFTTIADEIIPGQISSPNLDEEFSGLWGGLIILGNAPISADANSVQIEGIPPSDQNGLYGGNNPLDNSGILRYVSIRHGGSNIGEGNEINGLTLGGVGSGTVIEYIEIVANQDDGIEWFGGNVNVTNALVWNAGDDGIDTDQSWGGTLDNFIVINAGDECFELDGPEGSFNDEHTIINGTVYADGADGLIDLDDNSRLEMSNIYFYGLSENQDFDQLPVEDNGGYGVFSNFEATIPDGQSITDFFVGGSDLFVTNVPELQNTVGADASKFTGWTWASTSNKLADLGL